MRLRGVSKFLSGFFGAAALGNWYLAWHNISVPFGQYTATPHIEGIKAVVFLVLFLIFFYLGFLKGRGTY